MVCMSIDDIKKCLKENLTEERYEHSLGVADCAKRLAEKYGLDKEKAYLTGLIHDCAKCMPNEDALKIMQTMELCEGEITNPKTYHAPVGACVAKDEYNIDDEEILSAIRWHTLGKPNMTTFEKIIFLADKIEERTRPHEIIDPIIEALNSDGLDSAILLCYKNTIKSLVDRNLKICKITIDIYNSLL